MIKAVVNVGVPLNRRRGHTNHRATTDTVTAMTIGPRSGASRMIAEPRQFPL